MVTSPFESENDCGRINLDFHQEVFKDYSTVHRFYLSTDSFSASSPIGMKQNKGISLSVLMSELYN